MVSVVRLDHPNLYPRRDQIMREPQQLPRRHPGTHLPPAAYRAVGRAEVVYLGGRWSTDLRSVEMLRDALRHWAPR